MAAFHVVWHRSRVASEIVLLHGFTQTGKAWDPVVHELGEKWRAFAPDLGGHGDSPALGALSFAGEAAMLDALAPPRFLLCGYSMGGRIALYYALHRPERVKALVLVSASPGLRDSGERAARRRADDALAGTIEARPLADFAHEWGSQPLFADQPGHVASAANADRLRNTSPGLAAALRGLGTGVMVPLWDRLAELDCPVLVVVGERDAKFRALGEQMVRATPRSRLMVVPGAGHAVHLERPFAVVQAIEAAAREA